MKSFITEEKTILKAIEKAMEIAQYPLVFNIKILEKGNNSLLWWHNKSAVILFSYEHEKTEQSENKKYIKKNYSKEEAFLNKKVTNHFKEAEYTSSIKQEKQKQEKSCSRDQSKTEQKNGYYQEQKSEKQQDNEYIAHQEQYKKNHDLSNSRKKKITEFTENKINRPDESLKSSRMPKKTTEENSFVASNKENTSQSGPKEIEQNNNHAKPIEKKEITLVEWKHEYCVFVDNWINQLNNEFHFSPEPVQIKIEADTLIIYIDNFNVFEAIEKKHLFSSIVILLYEHLKEKFTEFDSKSYKIIMK